MSQVKPSLKAVLKRLKLSGLVDTLPDRAAYAQKAALTPFDFLELALQDEIDRRENKNLATRLDRAGFDEAHTFEDFDWDAPVTFDRDRVRDLFSLQFLERHEDVLFLGPVGVGKTFLACALGHSACRAGHRVLFLRSDALLKLIHQSRADNSTERVIRSLLTPDLLIIDDFGLRRLNAQQSSDFYEVVMKATPTGAVSAPAKTPHPLPADGGSSANKPEDEYSTRPRRGVGQAGEKCT
ncbi:MAG: ATP-binding protein [Thioalkalivibrio sp.]|nr:ATP-binding protein [Thioalkalivibrio sp.]